MSKRKTKTELEEEIKELQNKYLMALADLENYKKRAKREFEEIVSYTNERIIKDLIPVLDNFERALNVKHLDVKHSDDNFSKGINLIYKELLNILKREGVESFESVGKEFDPRYHEAVSVAPSDQKDGIVLEELEKGYKLKDRLARPAKVVVAKNRC